MMDVNVIVSNIVTGTRRRAKAAVCPQNKDARMKMEAFVCVFLIFSLIGCLLVAATGIATGAGALEILVTAVVAVVAIGAMVAICAAFICVMDALLEWSYRSSVCDRIGDAFMGAMNFVFGPFERAAKWLLDGICRRL